jgi:hypothetical protein
VKFKFSLFKLKDVTLGVKKFYSDLSIITMTNVHLKAIPTCRITNYALAKAFYIDFLGFSIDWEHRFDNDKPVYMQISRQGLVIHLTENARFPTGVIVFVETIGLESFYQSLMMTENRYKHFGIQKTAWGTKQMEIADPFGNLFRFNENISE